MPDLDFSASDDIDSSITAEMQTQSIDYDIADSATTLDLQDEQFSIDYPKDIEIELVNETQLIDEGC